MKYTHHNTSFLEALVWEQGRTAVAHFSVDPHSDGAVVPRPGGSDGVPGVDGEGDPFFVRHYVDDGILVTVCLLRDGRCLRRIIASIASGRFLLLRSHGPSEPLLLDPRMVLDWNTCLDALGWRLNIAKLVAVCAPDKSDKL